MVLPGLLIEYLISGALSLIWLIPLFNKFQLFKQILIFSETTNIVLIGIGLYFIGMLIDIIAWSSTKNIKKKIRDKYLKRLDLKIETKKGNAYRRESTFAIYAPELAKEVAMRSSRDRIARGAIINSLFGTMAYIVLLNQIFFPLIVGLSSVVICFFMWKGFEQVSYGFEITAAEILNEKIKNQDKFKN